MINGAPTDNNAKLFKQGAHSVIDKSDFKVAKEYDTPDWSPDKAQQEMEQAITALGKTGFVGVYAANDGTAGGAIAAMKGNGVDPKKIPTTGQDAELAAIQRILAGEQYMTVYKAIKPEAEQAARAGGRAGQGRGPARRPRQRQGRQRPEAGPLGAARSPVAVTKDNIKDTIVKDGFWTAEQICTGAVRGRLQGGRYPVTSRQRPAAPRRRRPSRLRGERSDAEMSGETPVLALEGVSKSFGPVQALRDVDFEIDAGRGRRPRRRQRGREVHARQGDRGHPLDRPGTRCCSRGRT